MDDNLSYGTQLPDQVQLLFGVFDAHLGFMSEIRELLRERAALEKEYAVKLLGLVSKAIEKKAKRMPAVVLGEEPAKAWDENTVRRSTLEQAYTQLLASFHECGRQHSQLSTVLSSEVGEQLTLLQKQKDETKQLQVRYYQKLVAERDKLYQDREKSMQKYYDECMEVESYRQKQERAQADRHAERAAKQYEQQKVDMNNAKNTYLVSIAIANKAKDKFYAEDIPEVENQLQAVQTAMTLRLTGILNQSQSLLLNHLDTLKAKVSAAQLVLQKVDHKKDQELFIQFNQRPFTAPQDWVFEPCPGYYEAGTITVEPEAKVFLQNKLSRAIAKLAELTPVLDSKEADARALRASLKPEDGMDDAYLETAHQVTFYAMSKNALQAEEEVISNVLGDDQGSLRPHSFKSSSFSIPTTCAYCKTSIWGLSKQGKTCKLCGISVHSKCELKIPAECSHAQGSVARTSSTFSRKSHETRVTPTPSSFAPTSVPEEPVTRIPATILFDFTASSAFEISVSEGSQVYVVEEDDGSGWIKVATPTGASGLVPASYVQYNEEESDSQPAYTGRSAGSGVYVKAIYAYEAQGADELSLAEGDWVELTAGPSGGKNYGDGWWEGIDKAGRKGIFPSNYVE